MPTYTYQDAEGGEYEVQQRITEAPLSVLEVAPGEFKSVKRVISGGAGFVLKSGASGGWSSTGYGHTPGQLDAMRVLGRPLTKRAE
jgi:predicted nucleic acid-binding Zn ribbon protein